MARSNSFRRRLLRIAAAAAFVLAAAWPAGAVTPDELVALSKAGLGDEVLVALVEADGRVFTLDPKKILELKAAGLSDRVLLALVTSGRSAPPAPAPVAPAVPPAVTDACGADCDSNVAVIGGSNRPAPIVRREVVVIPWWPGLIGPPSDPEAPRPAPPREPYRGFGRFINDGWVDRR